MALSLLYIYLQHNVDIYVCPLHSYAALGLVTEEPIEKVPFHVYRGPNGIFGTCDVVST
jgi:hypothetical protein